MSYIASVGVGQPPNEYRQDEVKQIVKHLFHPSVANIERFMSIFDHAKIDRRRFVVDKDWLQTSHTFSEKNNLYIKFAKKLSLEAIDDCLTNNVFLQENIPYEAIDCIIFTTSTGIVTPTVDAYLINERPFREDITRIPLWGLGCAGGAISLATAANWLRAQVEKTVLIVCCELCSLAFQKEDKSVKNIVGTAIFADGVAATLLVGKNSKYRTYLHEKKISVGKSSSFTKKATLDIMGWNITDYGFDVIFSKQIPQLIPSMWQHHFNDFLRLIDETIESLSIVLAHPGGRKVLEKMESVLNNRRELLAHSYNVLKQHGNMSAATVLYVLKQWYETLIKKQSEEATAILSALGPGFSSELLQLKWG